MSIDTNRNKFDSVAFNEDFHKYIDARNELIEKQTTDELNKLNTTIYKKKFSDMSFNELKEKWSTTLLDIVNDVIHLRMNIDTISKDDRLFFIGITILMMMIFFYVIHVIFDQIFNSQSNTAQNLNIAIKLIK